MCTVQQRIAELARERPHECFTALNHYLNVEWLKAAYERVKPDSAPGVDGQSWADYGKNLEENLRNLLDRVKSGSYVAPPVKRVYIPKGDGETRPASACRPSRTRCCNGRLSCCWNRSTSRTSSTSRMGFRPGRSAHEALACIWSQCMHQGIRWILEVDIRKYFDTLKKAWLGAVPGPTGARWSDTATD